MRDRPERESTRTKAPRGVIEDHQPHPLVTGQADASAEVFYAAKGVRDAEREVCEAATRLTAAVRDALEAGVRAVDVAEIIGVTRARVYQIRDGRR